MFCNKDHNQPFEQLGQRKLILGIGNKTLYNFGFYIALELQLKTALILCSETSSGAIIMIVLFLLCWICGKIIPTSHDDRYIYIYIYITQI